MHICLYTYASMPDPDQANRCSGMLGLYQVGLLPKSRHKNKHMRI